MAGDNGYETQAQIMLERIEQALETRAPEIEFETQNEILTLEFPDGSRIVVNKQRPLKQIWLAARAGGFHYDYDAATGCWMRGDGHELLADLETFASGQLQRPVRLR
ncbi:iron donor protein CyaY [Acidiferrobacter sp.]|uniref:iron donor protein CyaY n=1 Tax=Acidiferrobacter sp. TaxID=1872107 RepID=UPI002618FD38|nr:iron donor protein CyaY [Acidiferrobacter sp.]